MGWRERRAARRQPPKRAAVRDRQANARAHLGRDAHGEPRPDAHRPMQHGRGRWGRRRRWGRWRWRRRRRVADRESHEQGGGARGIVAVVDRQHAFAGLPLVTDLYAQAKAGLAFAERNLGRHIDGATTLQVSEGRRDLVFYLRLARTALGRLPTERKRLWLVRRGGTRGSNEDQHGPERR